MNKEKYVITAIKSINENPERDSAIGKLVVVPFGIVNGKPALMELVGEGKTLRTSTVKNHERLTDTSVLIQTQSTFYLLVQVADKHDVKADTTAVGEMARVISGHSSQLIGKERFQ